MKNFSIGLTVCAMLLINGCQNTPLAMTSQSMPSMNNASEAIQNRDWTLISVHDASGHALYQDLFHDPEKPLIVRFSTQGVVHLINTCNHLRGSYRVGDGMILAERFLGTRMLCPPQKMAFDELATKVVSGKYRLKQNPQGRELIIQSGDVTSVFNSL